MLSLKFSLLIVILIVTVKGHLQLDPPGHNHAFDLQLYEDVLDPEECAKQLSYIIGNDTMLLMQFLDAGARTPRGLFTGNLRDMGNYFQCLGIQKQVGDSSIEGKYCVMQIPLQQNESIIASIPEIPQIPWPNVTWPPNQLSFQSIDEEIIKDLSVFDHFRRNLGVFLGVNYEQSFARVAEESQLAGIQFSFAVCLPKVCSIKFFNAVDDVTPNVVGPLKVEEAFCRLPNDKTWVAADTVAVVVFSFIGLVVVSSTIYDVFHNVILKKAPIGAVTGMLLVRFGRCGSDWYGNWNTSCFVTDLKQSKTLYTTFSVFTNSRKFFTFYSSPNAITCLDGIRSIAMMWVIIGHTFATQASLVPANPLATFHFITAFSSIWITSAPITVDTFFLISGLLLVYTIASKLSKMSLLKNLHLFYLNRLLRMFPVLATGVLMQASFQNRVTDGPYWHVNANNTNDCRQYWWTTLLYVQNLVNSHAMCLDHTWYLAIDMQLYILSPIILYWVLGGNKLSAWTALAGALMSVITASTIYNFILEFQSSPISSSRTLEESARYMKMYYFHPLTRAAPFFVGMVFGYAMHSVKGKTMKIPKLLVSLLWIIASGTTTAIFISTYYIIQPNWNNQTVDNILNSFMRPAWAASIGWLVFACTKGYGGPINWFLSLHIFKILGRLSYAMYILHYPLIHIVNGTAIAPIFFSVEHSIHRFIVDFVITVIAAYLVTILIDLPFSRLIGMLLGGNKKHLDAKKNDELKEKDDEAPDVSELNKTHNKETPSEVASVSRN